MKMHLCKITGYETEQLSHFKDHLKSKAYNLAYDKRLLEVKAMKRDELRKLHKDERLTNYSKLKKDELITKYMEHIKHVEIKTKNNKKEEKKEDDKSEEDNDESNQESNEASDEKHSEEDNGESEEETDGEDSENIIGDESDEESDEESEDESKSELDILKEKRDKLQKELEEVEKQIQSENNSESIKNYLIKIKSSSRNVEYKRICLSPLRYAGGKSKAIGLILKHLPKLKEKTIVSPFFGGGSFEIVLSKELGYKIIGYDIFSFLTNFWNEVIHNNESLIKELKKLIPDKENYTKNRHILLNYWNKVKPEDLNYNTKNHINLSEEEKSIIDNNKTKQAAYYYYNMQLSYGPMFLGWPSSVYLKKNKYENIIKKLENINLGNIEVKCEIFENVIKKHSNDFLFLDPPYFLGKDSKMFKGMYPNCNFAIHHNNFNHELMRDLLKKHKGGFFITYNDCPTIRKWYSEFKQVYPQWQYTYGQGEKRIGKNRKNNKDLKANNDNIKKSHEIFIICEPQYNSS